MNRRNFLRMMIAGSAVAAAPNVALALASAKPKGIYDDLQINWVTKTIEFVGDGERSYTVAELYEWMKRQYRNDPNQPTYLLTTGGAGEAREIN